MTEQNNPYSCPNCESTEFDEIVKQNYIVKTDNKNQPEKHIPTGMIELLLVRCKGCDTEIINNYE